MDLFTVTVHHCNPGHHTWIKLCPFRSDFNSKISRIHRSELQSKMFSDSLCNMQPINVLLTVDVAKAGNDCFKLLLKTTKDQEEEEATVHLVNNGCC